MNSLSLYAQNPMSVPTHFLIREAKFNRLSNLMPRNIVFTYSCTSFLFDLGFVTDVPAQ